LDIPFPSSVIFPVCKCKLIYYVLTFIELAIKLNIWLVFLFNDYQLIQWSCQAQFIRLDTTWFIFPTW
jgi:hypothetical protein